MENNVLLANKQFTKVLLCPALVCSLVPFPAVSPCHLHPTGAASVLESEFITGASLQKLSCESLQGLHQAWSLVCTTKAPPVCPQRPVIHRELAHRDLLRSGREEGDSQVLVCALVMVFTRSLSVVQACVGGF